MTLDQFIDWGLRVVMVVITVLVALWGRNQKQADDLVESKADGLRRIAEHDRHNLEQLVNIKAALLDQFVAEKSRALDRLFESQFALRDQRMMAIQKQLEDASERASDAASKLTVKMADVDHRLTVLETRLAQR